MSEPAFVGGDDDLGALAEQARRRPLLTGADEVRLARRIERGDRLAKEQMVESNLRLVFAIARTYRGRGVPFADLAQEGTIGLVRAVEGFDHRRGLKFSTYAVWWIRRAMHDAIRSAPMIRVPAQAAREIAAIRRAESELDRDGVRHASAEALAEVTGISTRSIEALRAAGRVTRSLDETVGADGVALAELIADDRVADPVETTVNRERPSEVAALLRTLPTRYREVVRRRYGVDGARPQSHAEIGAFLGVGEERSRQLEQEALRRLREVARPALQAA